MALSAQDQEARMETFRQAFKQFDKNGDGHINKKELGIVMKQLGLNPSQEELTDMIASVDTDGSGTIQWDEFLVLMTEKRRTSEPPRVYTKAEIETAFKQMDTDGNGFITRSELKDVLGGLGQHYTDEELTMMISEIDKDGDGKVNSKEFMGMMAAK